MELTRREALVAASALAAAAASPALAAARRQSRDSLDAAARRKHRRFGTAVGTGRPGLGQGPYGDPAYRALVAQQCGVIVPENELKWGWVRRTPGRFDFDAADRLLGFAESNGMAFRGHNLLWHHPEWLPRWLLGWDFGPNPGAGAERMLREHIETVCRRYGRRIYSYDVVNEAVDNQTGVLRETVFSKAMGRPEAVLDLAFHTAREAAPRAQLVYNDYMSWEPGGERHRAGVLRLLEGFRARRTPIDALGVQSHISPVEPSQSPLFGARQAEWRAFVERVIDMGYQLVITEFDVDDRRLPADVAVRDRSIADYTRAYFDLMLSYAQVGDVLSWGLSDRYSWLQGREPRPERQAKRPLPYDVDMRPKPMRETLAQVLASATPAAARHVGRG